MSKKLQVVTPIREGRNVMCVDEVPGLGPEQQDAAIVGNAVIRGAATGSMYAAPMFGQDVDLTAFAGELQRQANAVTNGDLSGVETMLMTQANTLDVVFNQLARMAATSGYLPKKEIYLRQALKAQSQCRATLQTLAEIKNPRTVFAKQANIAHGPQQVNNGVTTGAAAGSRACAQENDVTQSNELLEHHHGERLDIRATGTASGSDPAMAAVGEVDGAEIR
ncbi:hypothetical protein [Burkholderia seminalis]|uniref:hypothetical protein n=1 Tax=Burkholderia seminalis TaxID=488731 RepID=UPI002650FF4F|nr:hypothetical protein [Burkholderia seminalis]MDN7592365.1 hypothetical protein [Burkholderia seminalis]